MDDLFKRELEKRQISSLDDIPNEPAPTRAQTRATPPPGFARQEDDVPDQLKKSRELNSEGLEGLPGRASQLLQLGLSFFLAFGPFIAAVVLAFFAIYAVGANAILGAHYRTNSPLNNTVTHNAACCRCLGVLSCTRVRRLVPRLTSILKSC